MMKKALLFLALVPTLAFAQMSRPSHVLLGGVSHHYHNKHHADLTGNNAGLGLMWQGQHVPVLGEVDVSVGAYRNSERGVSSFVAVHKLPLPLAGGMAGVTLAMATGYQLAPLVIVPSPTICWRYACLLVTPPFKHSAGAVSLQFRWEIGR